jgi:opacity protein-like surface antigen
MKCLALLVAAVVAISFVPFSVAEVTPALSQGTKELAVSGNYDPDAFDDYQVALEVGYGYFIADNLEVGASVGYAGSEHVDIYGILGFVEYNFNLGGRVVPYVRASVGWLGAEVEDPVTGIKDDNDTAAAAGAVGVKYFITDTVALALEGEYTKATDDIFINDDNELEDDNIDFNLSLRFYIP